jgi:acyl carrier protein
MSSFQPDRTSERIRRFLTDQFLYGDAGRLADDTPLLESGIVDSTGMLEIIGFLETEFGLHVLDHELIPANLNSVASLAAFVERKSAQTAPAR